MDAVMPIKSLKEDCRKIGFNKLSFTMLGKIKKI
jgi:hypothetical protein